MKPDGGRHTTRLNAIQQKRPGQARPSVVPHAAASTSVVNGTWLGDRIFPMYALIEF